jgi:2-iminoacetate synthase
MEEIAAEAKAIEAEGHKRILMLCGEHPKRSGLEYFIEAIDTVYSTTNFNGEIRRINVEVAPLSVEEFKRLKAAKIGTYLLFQETYHHETYKKMHPSGPKRDFEYRVTAMHRAQEAGIDDVGMGALFGLYDYKYEVIGLLHHAQHLEKHFGVGPHTISIPRLEPALNAPAAIKPPHPVTDEQFKKLVAILRLAVPYTGIILTTRESAALRNEIFSLGVSQISAGSRTNPGGYHDHGGNDYMAAQFNLGDTRSLDEVIYEVVKQGMMPSFCTACYRLGRTGADFMELAKPGLIKKFCRTNAVLTFEEYLLDYASKRTKKAGAMLVERLLEETEGAALKRTINSRLKRMKIGERDLYI